MKPLKCRILVVDDDPVFRKYFKAILSGKNLGPAPLPQPDIECEMDFASNGRDAFEMARAAFQQGAPYAIAFVDVHMPGWDGIQTVSRIWEIDPDLQIIICTALEHSWNELKERLGSERRFAILKKPLDPVEVVHLVSAFADKWELLKQLREQTGNLLHLQTAALEAAVNGIIITDRSGKILWVNQAFSRVTGYGSDEVIGQTPAIQKSGAHDESFYRDLWQTVLGGKVWHGEITNRRKDGVEYCEDLTITPVADRSGEIKNFVGIKRDISKHKKFEQELQEASSLLKSLLDNVPDMIYFKDLQSRFVHVSKSFEKLFRISDTSQLLGKTDFDFFSEEHARPAYDDEQRIIRTGQPLLGKLEKETHPDGRVTWCITNKLPWRNASGQILGTFGISKDVTALHAAEEDRAVMQSQLQQAQKLEAIGQLAAGIAHEINTPTQYVGDNTRFLKDSFASIAGALRACEELLDATRKNAVTPDLLARVEETVATSDLQYLFEQIPAAIKETLEGVDRVSKIVRAMKEFSHPGDKQRTAVDLNRAIESTITVASNEWKYVADVKLDLDPDLPLVPCFIGEFNQSILNLIVNAAHAIGDVVKSKPGTKGLITISSRRDGDDAEIRVTDTGTGIPEAVRPHIFEPFFTTKGIGKGTGQGLSIVYGSIVKKHGGSVRFETEAGQGTSFILRLPLIAPASEAIKTEKNYSTPTRESGGILRR
jgi:nitrogen fixation negative regulator NifL